MRRALAVAFASLALALPAVAHAEEMPPPPPAPPVAWRWETFRAWEYPATAAALGGAIYLRVAGPNHGPSWTGGILADDFAQDNVSIKSVSLRAKVVNLTDILFYGSMGYRFVDSVLVPSVVWGRGDVALQMSLIDLESFGFVAIALWGNQALFGRERPFAKRCGDPAFAGAESGCAPDSSEHNRSFFAGHPAVVLTAAGLTCTHHSHLPLYGGGAPDMVACGVMIGAAGATGIGRLMTEKHHLSDVIVGWGLGVVAGWVLPEVLHYRNQKAPPVEATREPPPLVRASLVPMIGPHDLGMGLGGLF